MVQLVQCLLAQQIVISKKISEIVKFVPEGVEGRVEYKEGIKNYISIARFGLGSSMGYIGALKNLKEINKKAKFIKITKAGLASMVHENRNDTKDY